MEQHAALKYLAMSMINNFTSKASTVTPNKQATNKIAPFSPVAARRDAEPDEKPEFIDMNKLEQQQQQAFDNNVGVIQPFQPLED